MLMDYSYYASNFQYYDLVDQFEDLTKVLTDKLFNLEEAGFDLENQGFLFGYSFGARMVVAAGIAFGNQKIAQIDGKFISI